MAEVEELERTLALVEAARETAEEDFRMFGVPDEVIAGAVRDLDGVIAHLRALIPGRSGPPEERTITLPHEVWEAASHYAARRGWSVDRLICELIRRWLEGEVTLEAAEAS